MSLIEKAAGKIEQAGLANPPAAPVHAEVPATASARVESSLIERSIAAQDDAPIVLDRPAASPQPVAAAAPAGTPDRSSQMIHIDLDRLRTAGMVTPDEEKTQLAEEFRQIKRPLITNAFDSVSGGRHRNLIMVTSSLPGEGKSFCSLNLALSIAMERDHTVMLVDADVAKPSVMATLGLRNERGLMDLMLDPDLKMPDVLLRTNFDKLSILPAGRGHKLSTEILASDAMSRLLTEMAERYPDRIIIFDSPPLLVTSEARELASHMGQIVMVVEAGRTSREAVKEALHQIEGCDIINLLVNKTSGMPGMEGYGGYGGYGGYTGYGYGRS